MNKVKSYSLPGYYDKEVAEKAKAALQGKGYMKIDVVVSNQAGNYTITATSDQPGSAEEFRGMVLYILINELAKGGQ